jgi:hypothetical protein
VTSQEMVKTECGAGYWLVNVAKLGEEPNWIKEPVPHDTRGTIFGYAEEAFLKRQYK